MTDTLPPALAELCDAHLKVGAFELRHSDETIVATLRAVARAVDDGEMDLDYALWSINRWADEIEKGTTNG